jgi:integrase/recombinase XerD
MKLSDVVKLYLLDMRVVPFTQKHIKEVDRELQRLLEWFDTQGITQIEDVTHVHLKMYQIQLQDAAIAPGDRRISLRGRKFTPITVRGYMRKIRAFFSWCEKEGYLNGPNPMVRVPKIKIPSYVIAAFTPEQMDAMLNSCDLETALGFRDYTILLLLMDTGMRVSELCGLKLSSLREGYLVVFGKGSKERELTLGPTSTRALYKYIYVSSG